MLTLWLSPSRYLQLDVTLQGARLDDFHDGDRYRVTLIAPNGKRVVDVDETVEQYTIMMVGAPCTQRCPAKTLDLRGASDRDAVSNDAGS